MEKILYNKLCARLDSLGAIRMHEVYQGPDSEPGVDIEAPILSDCIFGYDESLQKNPFDKNTVNDMYYLLQKWDMNKPYLREQSDELGKKLFELLS